MVKTMGEGFPQKPPDPPEVYCRFYDGRIANGNLSCSRVDSAYHRGVDINGAQNENPYVLCPFTSTIVRTGLHYSYGNFAIGRMEEGTYAGKYWLCGHFAYLSCAVGDVLLQGQMIGYEGSTGNSSGDHVHVELRYENSLDEASLIKGDALRSFTSIHETQAGGILLHNVYIPPRPRDASSPGDPGDGGEEITRAYQQALATRTYLQEEFTQAQQAQAAAAARQQALQTQLSVERAALAVAEHRVRATEVPADSLVQKTEQDFIELNQYATDLFGV